jgi:acyl transferase domain-containing protein
MPADPRTELLLLSANTAASLKEQVNRYRDFANGKPDLRSADLAYTLAMRREKLPHRAFAIMQNGGFTETSSLLKAPPNPSKIYMIFSGQGAQWPGMGKELIESDPLFRRDIEMMDDVLQRLIHPPSWAIMGEYQVAMPNPLAH